MKAKGLVANWEFNQVTVACIEKVTEDIIVKYKEAYDRIGQIKAEDVTFDNTIKALIDLEREMITEQGPMYFPQHVVTDKAIRDASVAADKKLSVLDVDLSMKKDVFDNVCAFKERFGLDHLTSGTWSMSSLQSCKQTADIFHKKYKQNFHIFRKCKQTHFSKNVNKQLSLLLISTLNK